MQGLIADIRANCEEFIWQPDDHLLLVSGTDGDIPYVLKVLEQVEGQDEASLYLMIADPYVDAESYGLTVAQHCEQAYELVNQERLARDESLLPAFPPRLSAPKTPPRDRIVLAIEHLGQRLPSYDDYRVVVVLLPISIHDWVDYAAFVGNFAGPAPEPDEPWRAYARLFMRDDREHSLGAGLQRRGATGVLSFDVDMSTEAMAAEMSREAVDPAVPIAQRMQSIMQLANIDLSYRRYDEAQIKLAVLFDYYQKADAPFMQALCLQGSGDCLRMSGSSEQALHRYQQGLATVLAVENPLPPSEANSGGGSLHPNAPPVLLNLLLSAAATSLSLQSYADARSYYEDASKVAAKCMNPFAACDALQGQGDAYRALGEAAEAERAWRDCMTIAETYEYYDRLVSVLERLLELYVASNLHEQAEQTRSKLETAKYLQTQRAA